MKLVTVFTLDFWIAVLCVYGGVLIGREINWAVMTWFYRRKYSKRCVRISAGKYETFVGALHGVLKRGGRVAMQGESVTGKHRAVIILDEEAVTW